MKWDQEMIKMKEKLDYLINENYIMFDLETRDYKFYPKSEGKPEGYDKWYNEYLTKQRSNEAYKSLKRNVIPEIKRKRNRNKEDAPTYVCEHCGYTTQTYFVGAFNRHHNDNCKHKKETK
jgi:AraC-like DNA-binding protein